MKRLPLKRREKIQLTKINAKKRFKPKQESATEKNSDNKESSEEREKEDKRGSRDQSTRIG